MRKLGFCTGLSLAFLTTVPAFAGSIMPTITGGNVNNGKTLFTLCIACHQANGEGNKNVGAPKISGQHDWYLTRQLRNFKAGIRGTHASDVNGARMRPMAMTLATDQAIDDVVAYIMTLK